MFDNFILSKYSKGGKPEWQYHLLDHIVFEMNPQQFGSFSFETKTYALSLQFELAAKYHRVNTSQGIKPRAWHNERDRLVRKVQRFLTGSSLKGDSMVKPNIEPAYNLYLVEQLLRIAVADSGRYHMMPQWRNVTQEYMHNILNHVAGRRRRPLDTWVKRVEALINLIYAESRCSYIFDEEEQEKIIW